MKRNNSKSWCSAVIICCATLLFCFSAQASVQENGTSLMLEASPVEGGFLNIPTGVHAYDIYSDVTLKATPKPGYQFVCWLGSVSNSVTSSTTVFLNSPKMVIAVFERSEYETPGVESGYLGGGGDNGGGMVRSEGLSDSSLEEAQQKYTYPTYHYTPAPPPAPEPPPVPTPEPATVTLFFTAFLMLVNRRKNGVNLTDKM
ncbi:MAG: PEP-CTERM sorting domain-containing protein [Sedimentisphaerales bacterium]